MSNNAQWLGYTAAVLTTSSFFPQALKTLRSNETAGISLRMYVLFTLGVSAWAIYGLWNRDWPVLWANVVTLLPAAAVLERKVKASLRSARQ
tara:strand:- start:142 stop:417 length:276 start_codon:yes stop_codon:yes gene_type:complete